MEEMFKKGQGFMDQSTGEVIKPSTDIEYIFEEVTEPFEYKPEECNMENQIAKLNEMLHKHGFLDPKRGFEQYESRQRKVYLIEVRTDNGAKYFEDFVHDSFVLKAFSSKQSSEDYLRNPKLVAYDSVMRDIAAGFGWWDTDGYNGLKPEDMTYKTVDLSDQYTDENRPALILSIDQDPEFVMFRYYIQEMEVID